MVARVVARAFRALASTSTARDGAVRCFSSSSRVCSDEQMRMLIVGSPGSGKGTQSTRLLQHYAFSVLSAGDVLRSHIQRKTDIGQRADSVIKQGGLMPDTVMMDLIGAEVQDLAAKDWLLDGFPRTLGQAEMLDAMLESQAKPLRLVVNLDVPEDVILDRILRTYLTPLFSLACLLASNISSLLRIQNAGHICLRVECTTSATTRPRRRESTT